MTHASLFSGIGGFDLAAEWMGWNNLFHCEWNSFGQKVLKHHFPNSISYNDITKTDFTIHSGSVDILTGGFPCQPYSTAGKRLGKQDERHLFPEMLRCIKEVKPRWVVGENVRGLVSWNEGLVFHEVYDDLEREGYEVQSFLIPAASVGAPHQRYRVWFVAYANNKERGPRLSKIQSKNGEIPKWDNSTKLSDSTIRDVTDSFGVRLEYGAEAGQIQGATKNEQRQGGKPSLSIKANGYGPQSKWQNFPTKPAICGGNDGLSGELDGITFSNWRKESIKAYGNAIVPQVAHQIFKTIEEFEKLV